MKITISGKRIKGNDGFTLIEVLAALAVLGLLLPPIMGLFTVASVSNARSVRNTVALTVAGDIMDRIKTGDINLYNQEQRLRGYRDKYDMEILVDGIKDRGNHSLDLIKVYVASKPGMEPRTEGIMLSSYFANVYDTKVVPTEFRGSVNVFKNTCIWNAGVASSIWSQDFASYKKKGKQ